MTDEEYQALKVQADACEHDPTDVTDTIDPTEDDENGNS